MAARLIRRRRSGAAAAVRGGRPAQRRRSDRGPAGPSLQGLPPTQPTAVLVVAVEYFGQLSGRRRRALRDELHRRLEWELPQHLRASDVAYRESADRVCVLLPNTTLDEAHRVGERLRSVLEAGSLPTLAALEIGVTLAGVSELSGRG